MRKLFPQRRLLSTNSNENRNILLSYMEQIIDHKKENPNHPDMTFERIDILVWKPIFMSRNYKLSPLLVRFVSKTDYSYIKETYRSRPDLLISISFDENKRDLVLIPQYMDGLFFMAMALYINPDYCCSSRQQDNSQMIEEIKKLELLSDEGGLFLPHWSPL
jgi:hypothetical protein